MKQKEDKNKLGTTDFNGHMRRYKDGTPNWKQEKYEIRLETQRLKLKTRHNRKF
uniref:Uncharacterized protein n=1 Tax=viral metagenome TaxID=1070528 RepID=A0A6M3L222_9ZZZZ